VRGGALLEERSVLDRLLAAFERDTSEQAGAFELEREEAELGALDRVEQRLEW